MPWRLGDLLAPVHVAADDGAALVAPVLEDRQHGARRVLAALEGVGALHLVPAEVVALAGVEARRRRAGG